MPLQYAHWLDFWGLVPKTKAGKVDYNVLKNREPEKLQEVQA